MSIPHHTERQNIILASLSEANLAGLQSHLEHVTMPQGAVLYEAGATIRHVYFPRTALVSLVGLTAEGQGTEVGMIGPEGFLGIPIVFGTGAQQFQATVQITGTLDKVPIHVLDEKDGKKPLSDVLRRYAMVQLSQISQSAICNRFHTLSQRLCRWLLIAADRVATHRLELTQEYLAQMIGARRPAVAEVVGRLQKKGLIRSHRGCVEILHQAELEAATCECYQNVKNEIKAFLDGPDFQRRPKRRGR